MNPARFAQGVVLGVSLAAPVGPIGVLCFRRALAEGWGTGVAVGLGAATADALYAGVAAFGLSALSGFLMRHQTSLGVAGGLWLVWLGARAFRTVPAVEMVPTAGTRLAAYVSTLGLTLTNPATLVLFGVLFAGLDPRGLAERSEAAALVLGVFAGSTAWWVLLSGVGSRVGRRLGAGVWRWVNRVSGVVLVGFGLVVLGRSLR